MIRCKVCKSTDVEIGYWVNPNTDERSEMLFDLNEAPIEVGTQWCQKCGDHTELEEAPAEEISKMQERLMRDPKLPFIDEAAGKALMGCPGCGKPVTGPIIPRATMQACDNHRIKSRKEEAKKPKRRMLDGISKARVWRWSFESPPDDDFDLDEFYYQEYLNDRDWA